MRILLLLLGLTFAACRQGQFQDDRDYFQSVYGLSLQPYTLQGSIFIGRLVDTDHSPMPFTKIFLKGSPLYTTSNHKGGFYLTGLQAGRNTLYIVAANGLGRTLDVDWDGERWLENDSIVLDRMERVSGRVMSGAAPISEARIFVEGSPFSALTDASGQFVLEIPQGSYRIKAQHLLYNPLELAEQKIDGDRVQNLNLEPLGFPKAELSLEHAEGAVIRGLTAQINIKMSPGVLYMRVISHGTSVVDNELTSSRWIDVKKQLTLEHKTPGMSYMTFQFMDQFGKMTDPIVLSYYMTLLDSTWRLIYGHITEPVIIRSHEKVAFLNYETSGSGTTTPGFPAETSPSEPLSIADIDAPVDVEGGATLIGSAQFNRSVTLHGSVDAPVNWDLRNEEGHDVWAMFRNANNSWKHVKIQHGSLQFYEGSWMADHLDATDLDIDVYRYNTELAQDISITNSNLRRSFLRFSNVTNAPSKPFDVKQKLSLQGNNFLGNADSSGNYLSLSDSLEVHIDQNYFEFRDRIIMDFDKWKASLGQILDQPISLRQNPG